MDGGGGVIDDDFMSLHVSPTLTANERATQFISHIHINVLYKGGDTTRMVGSCRMIPPAHIAITSVLFFSETVTPLMLSVPCLLWPQRVNAHILHQSPPPPDTPS